MGVGVRAISTLLLGAALAAACSDATDPDSAACEAGTAQVEATITKSNNVVFDWQPRCPVLMLLVEDDAHDMWAILGPEDAPTPAQSNLILPPVTYGQVPNTPGVTQTGVAEPLIAGRTYELILWRAMPAGADPPCTQPAPAPCLIEVKEFVR